MTDDANAETHISPARAAAEISFRATQKQTLGSIMLPNGKHLAECSRESLLRSALKFGLPVHAGMSRGEIAKALADYITQLEGAA